MDDNPHPDRPRPDEPGSDQAEAPGDGLRLAARSGPASLVAVVRRWVAPVAVPAVIALAIAAGVDFINRHATTSDEAGKPSGPSGPVRPALDMPAPTLMAKGRPLPRHLVGVNRSGTAVVVR